MRGSAKRAWRNGRRSGLKIRRSNTCRFESDRPHHFLTVMRRALPPDAVFRVRRGAAALDKTVRLYPQVPLLRGQDLLRVNEALN